jgi:hypothetical protein
MAVAPGSSSSQYSLLLNFSERSAGTLFHLQTEEGEEILSFSPAKRYESIVFSSPELQNGTTYNVYFDGSSTGSQIDGLYEGGTYTPGDLYKTFTINSMVTTVADGSEGPGKPAASN